MRRITFYATRSGKVPVQEFLDSLPDKTAQKIAWVLRAVRDLERVPTQYLKKLVNTEDLWEVRVEVGRDTYRLLGFFDRGELIVLTNAFQKKSQKTPPGEIRLAEQRKTDYLDRRKSDG